MRFEWLVLALFLLALVVDHRFVWPSFVRRVARSPAWARHVLWLQWMALLWGGSLLVLGLRFEDELPMTAFGLELPTGWRLWAPAVLVVVLAWLQFDAALRICHRKGDNAKFRRQLGSTSLVLPHEAAELPAWCVMAMSAGFCEELLFRGFLIWLLQPVLGLWPAAIVSLALFAAAHAYQGVAGMVRTALLGAGLTLIVFLTHSLWPAIALHAVLDGMGGWIGWLILRDRTAPARPLPDEPWPRPMQ
jgi:membrane protease YdiL (CAAX protease family)